MSTDHRRKIAALFWALCCLVGQSVTASAANAYFREDDGQSCAGCHGDTGEGGGEGSLRVPALAPLLVPDGSYPTAEHLCSAVRDGMAADGRALSGLMPRQRLATPDCENIRRYLASMSVPVFRPGDDAIRVAIRVDRRSATQQRWRDAIAARLAVAGSGLGIHGRSIALVDGAAEEPLAATMALDLAGDGRGIEALAVISRDEPVPQPPRRSIESTLRQELAALAAGHPDRPLVMPGTMPDGPEWRTVESVGGTVVAEEHCADADHPIVILLDEDAAARRDRLCAPDADTYASLRALPTTRIEQLRAKGRWSGVIGVFAPVPLGDAMQSIPDRLATIVLDTFREMGREPTTGEMLRAFAYSWMRSARAGDTMFAGTSLLVITPQPTDTHRPTREPTDTGPRWLPAP